MAETQETVADIIAEMRGMGNYQQYSGDHARALADRLEAAHRRELSKNTSKNGADFGQLGNAAKLREAIDKCVNLITEFGNAEIVKTPLDVIIDIEAILKAALAAPPRNCDVGTPDEQTRRFGRFCNRYDHDCTGCPCEDMGCASLSDCFANWAQMPYEAEEGGDK